MERWTHTPTRREGRKATSAHRPSYIHRYPSREHLGSGRDTFGCPGTDEARGAFDAEPANHANPRDEVARALARRVLSRHIHARGGPA